MLQFEAAFNKSYVRVLTVHLVTENKHRVVLFGGVVQLYESLIYMQEDQAILLDFKKSEQWS